MEQVYILLSICCRKQGATKSQAFEAMKFFEIDFKEKDWQRLMRMNKYECDLQFLGGKWVCYDYCTRKYVLHVLEKEGSFIDYGLTLPYFYSNNRDKFRQYFFVNDFNFPKE